MRSLFRAAARLLAAGLCVAAPGVAAPAGAQLLLGVDTRLNRVVTLNAFDGSVVNASFITNANNPTGVTFQTPRAAIQVGDQVWVSDQSPNVNGIFRYDLSGNYLGTVGGADGGLSNVRGLRYIDGTVYAVNAGTTNGAPGPSIVSISSAGAILGSFSTAAVGGTIGASPWDVMRYDGRFLVSDGTSRALQLYNADGTYHGALTGPLNNIPQQMFLRANGNVLLAASGSTPTNSFGVYELGTDGAVVAQWTGTPGLGARGVYELGNGRYLVSESGGSSASRGLGTIDPMGPQNNTNFQLIQGLWNGGWISPLQVGVTTVPEPTAAVLLVPALAGLAAARRRRRS